LEVLDCHDNPLGKPDTGGLSGQCRRTTMSSFPGRDVMSEHLSCTLLWLRCTNPAPGLIPRSAGAMLDTRSGLLFLFTILSGAALTTAPVDLSTSRLHKSHL
jgi:hypothetical protein